MNVKIFIFPILLIFFFSFQYTLIQADPGDSIQNAISITTGNTDGTLPGPASDNSVWYKISLSSGNYIWSLTGPVGTDFDLDLFDSNSVYLEGAYHDTYPDSFLTIDLGSGSYYINVYTSSGTGTFTLSISAYTRVPGDYYDNPIRINIGNTTGTMLGPGTSGEIYYVITLSNGNYKFSLQGPGGTDFDLFLFNSDGENIGTGDGDIYPDILIAMDLAAGNYLIAIFPIVGSGTFMLNINTYIPPTGDSPANAIPITLGETVGELPGPGIAEETWYIISLSTGDVKLSLTGPAGTDFNLELFDNELNFIDAAENTSYPDILIVTDIEVANYLIAIHPISGSGVYSLTITLYEPGKSSSDAIVISLGDIGGNLPGPGLIGEIWYFISLNAGDYQFSLIGPGGTDFNFYLYDNFTNPIIGAYGNEYPESLIISFLESGSYYISILAINGTGDFTFSISIYEPEPEPTQTMRIELGETFGNFTNPAPDGEIWYNISLLAGDYQCSLIGSEGTNFDLELYDSTLTYVSGIYGYTYPDILTMLDLETSIYYINIQSNGGVGNFTLTISEYFPLTNTTSIIISSTTATEIISTDSIKSTSSTPIFFNIALFALILNSLFFLRKKR